MKFAQYLSDTQTPEWKKAYIDYRGLKKRITAIRKAQQGLNFHVASTDSPDEMPTPPNAPRPSDAESYDYEQSLHADRNSYEQPPRPRISKRSDQPTTESELIRPTSTTPIPTTAAPQDRKLSFVGRRPSFALPSLRLITRKSFSSRLGTGQNSQRMINPLGALPLHELLTHLSPHEVSFFTMLDAQLDKVESFYLAREKEMVSRGRMLQIQLNELKDHRKLFLGAHTKVTWATAVTAKLKTKLRLHRTSETEIWPPPQIDEDFAELAKSKTADEATLTPNSKYDGEAKRGGGRRLIR
ncbi:SPX domain-containing protein [Crassisporium funariophilum]|nr:SPX domain-containing protein [Crassisporium funariophilum]